MENEDDAEFARLLAEQEAFLKSKEAPAAKIIRSKGMISLCVCVVYVGDVMMLPYIQYRRRKQAQKGRPATTCSASGRRHIFAVPSGDVSPIFYPLTHTTHTHTYTAPEDTTNPSASSPSPAAPPSSSAPPPPPPLLVGTVIEKADNGPSPPLSLFVYIYVCVYVHVYKSTHPHSPPHTLTYAQ
jgi:hypothetical protein